MDSNINMYYWCRHQTSLVLSAFLSLMITSMEKNYLDYQYVDNWLLRVTSAIFPLFFSFFLWNANCKVGCFLMATVHYMSILTRLSEKGSQFFQLAWTVNFFVFNLGNIQSWYCKWQWSGFFFFMGAYGCSGRWNPAKLEFGCGIWIPEGKLFENKLIRALVSKQTQKQWKRKKPMEMLKGQQQCWIGLKT